MRVVHAVTEFRRQDRKGRAVFTTGDLLTNLHVGSEKTFTSGMPNQVKLIRMDLPLKSRR